MNTLRITQKDYIKANKIGNRLAELENQTGFVSIHKIHKSKKQYIRKPKHSIQY